MIIWLNGSFGVGKTTIANKLNSKLENSYVYDPENAGAFIWDNSPNCIKQKGDFQDIPMWRDINYKMIKYLNENYKGTIIVPMTIVNKKYYYEIIERLSRRGVGIYHYILLAEKSTILSRLNRRGEGADSWAARQVDRCLCAYEEDIEGIKIQTDNLSVEEIVEIILDKSYESRYNND